MTIVIGEAHVEHLLGDRVRDRDGKVLGRLEDFRVEIVEGESVVTEFHIGGGALIERITGFVSQLPLFEYLPFRLTDYRVRWQDMDLTEPRRPRVRLTKAELDRAGRGTARGST